MKKAILFIELEIQVLYLQLKFPNINKHTKSNDSFILDWDISDNDIIELSRALYTSQKASKNGKHAKFIDIVKRLEGFFGKKVIRPHNKAIRISERVDVAPFLDMLKDSYINDLESRL